MFVLWGIIHYESELSNDDLPWANVLLPTTAGSGKQNNAASVALSPGNSFGFLDGDNTQIPVISGTFGNTSIASIAGEYKGPFTPFTGYTGDVPAQIQLLAVELWLLTVMKMEMRKLRNLQLLVLKKMLKNQIMLQHLLVLEMS